MLLNSGKNLKLIEACLQEIEHVNIVMVRYMDQGIFLGRILYNKHCIYIFLVHFRSLNKILSQSHLWGRYILYSSSFVKHNYCVSDICHVIFFAEEWLPKSDNFIFMLGCKHNLPTLETKLDLSATYIE